MVGNIHKEIPIPFQQGATPFDNLDEKETAYFGGYSRTGLCVFGHDSLSFGMCKLWEPILEPTCHRKEKRRASINNLSIYKSTDKNNQRC
jgi:hypothetical protein